jgi:hypothetical protein
MRNGRMSTGNEQPNQNRTKGEGTRPSGSEVNARQIDKLTSRAVRKPNDRDEAPNHRQIFRPGYLRPSVFCSASRAWNKKMSLFPNEQQCNKKYLCKNGFKRFGLFVTRKQRPTTERNHNKTGNEKNKRAYRRDSVPIMARWTFR